MNKHKNKVESKYKNPDKHIEKLKMNLSRFERIVQNRDHDIEVLRKEKEAIRINAYGENWFSYKDPGHEMGVNLTRHDAVKVLENLELGTKIICFGEVTEFTRSKSGKNEANMMIKDVYLKRN